MRGVSVRKSSPEVIRPPEPVTTSGTSTIKLTSMDSVFVKIPFTALLVFEHPMSHEHATESIKRAVSQALVHYSPFAGRIISSGSDDGGGDRFSVQCTGEGVPFVAASADCSLEEAKIFDEFTGSMALLDQLAVYYQIGSYGSGDDPLLAMQVTEFSCGGLVLGVTWSHAMADGVGIAQLLAAVGELARGSPSPSITPARWDAAVSGLPPTLDPMREAMLACSEPSSPEMGLIVPLDVTVPSALINSVKAETSRSGFFSGGGELACTTFEAILAVLWQCRVRATMSDPGALACLMFSADIRRHVGAKDGYYGNCIATQLVAVAKSGEVASAGVVDLVRMIRHAKDKMPENFRGAGAGAGDDNRMMLRGLRAPYDVMNVTCWRNIGFEQVDLGSGPPVRVMFHAQGGVRPPVPFCILYPPCKGKDGVNVLSILMKEEHGNAFVSELANLCRARNCK